MQTAGQKDQLTITCPNVARALTENRSTTFLKPFFKGDVSLSHAAQALSLKLPTLLYHVNRFLNLGLLEVAEVKPRGGRSIKLYRTTAKAFFVPFEVTPSETLERLLGELTEGETKRFHREVARTLQNISPTWGLHVTLIEGDGVSFSLTPDEEGNSKPFMDVLFGPDAPAIISTEGNLRLDFETAKAFQKELLELSQRYSQKQKPNGQSYAYRLGLTPVQDDTLGS